MKLYGFQIRDRYSQNEKWNSWRWLFFTNKKVAIREHTYYNSTRTIFYYETKTIRTFTETL